MTVSVDDIAEVLASEIAGNNFGEAFDAQVSYVLKKSIENTRVLTAVVLPRDEDSEPKTRGRDLFTFVVDVAVIRPVTSTEPDVVKPLQALPRAVRKYMRGLRPVGSSWLQSTLKTPYSYDMLNSESMLVSIIQNRYTIIQ